jgi:hypothetical protein
MTQLAFQPALLYQGDSYAYIRLTQSLVPGHRVLGYPLFLRLVLGPGAPENTAPVPIVQHVLGLAVGVLIYVFLRHLDVAPVVAAVGAAPSVVDGFQLDIEQFVLAETLFTATVVLAFVLLFWNERVGPAHALAASLLMAFSTLTRPAGIALVVPLVLCLVLRRTSFSAMAIAAIGFLVPLAGYATWFHEVEGSWGLSDYGRLFLYGRVAHFARCDQLDLTAAERGLCDPLPPHERPRPDFYYWNPESPIRDYRHLPPERRDRLYSSFASEVLREQPLDYAREVAADTYSYFLPQSWVGRRASQGPWRFKTTPPRYDPAPYTLEAFGGGPPPEVAIDPGIVALLGPYQRAVHAHGPLLALAIVLVLVACLVRVGPNRRDLRPEAVALALGGLGMLAVPAVTATYQYRYLLPSIPLLWVAGVLAGWHLRHRIVRRLGRLPSRSSGEIGPFHPGARVTGDVFGAPERVHRPMPVALVINCELCGLSVQGSTEAEVLEKASEHIESRHEDVAEDFTTEKLRRRLEQI